MSNLIEHAKREMDLADISSDIYGESLNIAVVELLEVFSKQGHSGMSASLVLTLFSRLAKYENLSPLTDDPDEWYFHEENVAGIVGGFHQNKRNSAAFSEDGGKTYYLTSDGSNNNIKKHIYTTQHKIKE